MGKCNRDLVLEKCLNLLHICMQVAYKWWAEPHLSNRWTNRPFETHVAQFFLSHFLLPTLSVSHTMTLLRTLTEERTNPQIPTRTLAHTYAHTHEHARACKHTRAHIHTQTHTHTQILTHTNTHEHTNTHTHTNAHTHTDTQTHRHTDTQTHTRVHTRTHILCLPQTWRWFAQIANDENQAQAESTMRTWARASCIALRARYLCMSTGPARAKNRSF